MSTTRRQDLLAVALLLVLPSLFFGDVLIGRNHFAARDLTRYYYPTKQIYGRIVAGGEFPLWNRYFHGGQPLAANPEHEIFYPLTWLLMLPDFDLGYRLHILLHIGIALVAMYALLRSMRAGPPAAFFGALSWGLGGLMLSYINLLPILFCAAWLPLTCLFARRFLMQRRRRDFALASLFFGLQCLVAEPTTLVQTGFLIGMYALYRGWRSERRLRQMSVNVALVAGISAAAFAVGAVQLLPAIEHAGHSARAVAFPFELVEAWSTPWGKLIELVYPNALGHVQRDGEVRYWAGQLYAPMGAPFLFSIYPGLAVVALTAAGIARRTRGALFTIIVVAVSAVLALGSHTPLLRFLYDTGVATRIRYPEKFLLIGIFAMTVFAAIVCQRLLDGDRRLRDAAAGFALASALIAAAISLLGLLPLSLTLWSRFFQLARDRTMLEMAGIAWMDWSVAAARGLVLFLLLMALSERRRTLWLAAALLVVAADLGPVVHELNPRLSAAYFQSEPEVLRELDGDRAAYRVFHLADWEQGDRIGNDYPDDDARYRILKNGLFPMLPAAFGIQTVLERDYDETALLPTVELTRALWEVRRSGRPDWLAPFLSISNVRYVGVATNDSERPVRFIDVGHKPRYSFARELVPIATVDDFVAKLSTARHREGVAFIEGRAFRPAAGRIHRVRESANRATLDVHAEGKAFLVMSVTPHRHWRVTIDGDEVKPVRTNVGYQGVVVERGSHRIVMQYANPTMMAGAAISLAAVALLMILAVLRRVGAHT